MHKKVKTILVTILTAIILSGNNYLTFAQKIPVSSKPEIVYSQVNALDLVASPQDFVGNNIKIIADFDKFSTLGLDYKPAFRDSKKYISFIIKRPDSAKDITIPLSELKLIIQRDKAEKLVDLENGDRIEISGKVFSAALKDPWVDVDQVKILESKVKNVSDSKKLK